MIEEWEDHFHLELGKSFEMTFNNFGFRTFQVIRKEGGDLITARDLETSEEFQFFRSRLLKREYSTLREIID